MKTIRLPFLVLGALATTAAPLRAGIDFTLHTRQAEAASGSENQYITDGENHIYLHIPHGWSANGGGQLVLSPDKPGSEVLIRQLGGAPALPLDAAGLAVLRKMAQAALPQGAKDIKPFGEINDLLPVFGWKSFEVTFDYNFFGQQMRRSFLYINMIPGRVVAVQVTAAVLDFDQVHEKVRKLMFGWFEPNRDLTPDAARDYEEGGLKGS